VIMKSKNISELTLLAIAIVNLIATIYVASTPTEARETKLWELYTVSVTGLYGYVVASGRIAGGES
jgi:hypothetical protein